MTATTPPPPIAASVIIPAFNAASTISATLAALAAQTTPHWEAIVVDDGSTDDTAAVVTALQAHRANLRLLRQPNRGVSAARNLGIAAARHDWLLFLDADDLISPDHLASLIALIAADLELDAVYSGWARLTPEGSLTSEHSWKQNGDMFSVFARLAPFPIHSCLARRSLITTVGAFDTGLRTCEDWDLWQRIARAGARFESSPHIGAIYRMMPASASIDARQMLIDGLAVLRCGHAADPRVPAELNRHPAGAPPTDLPALRVQLVAWNAGLLIGVGSDARPLLDLLPDHAPVGLDPQAIAEAFFRSTPLPSCRPPTAWPALWPKVAELLALFLSDLESRSGTVRLSRRVTRLLEQMILAEAAARPFLLGSVYAVAYDVSEPLADLIAPAGADRLDCAVSAAGAPLGQIQLPVCDGKVDGAVLADAIAAEYCWSLMGRLFTHTLYPSLRTTHADEGIAIWRGEVLLAAGLPAAVAAEPALAHDQIGWTALLQEVWASPDHTGAQFYDATAPISGATLYSADQALVSVESSAAVPTLTTTDTHVPVALRIGGGLVGVIGVASEDGQIQAAALRAALTTAGGMEICRVAVRVGVIGQPFGGAPDTLRARLAAAAAAPRPTADAQTLVLTRRLSQPVASSAARLAVLPADSASELLAMAGQLGEHLVSPPGAPLTEVRYDPDRLPDQVLSRETYTAPSDLGTDPQLAPPSAALNSFGRSFFETLFARAADPWRYTGPYEQTKYAQTLALIPNSAIGDALEIACAEGHFTQQLAPRVKRLLATDISQIALDRTAARCAQMNNITYTQLDLVRDAMPGEFDLIVCSEVLYYTGDRDALAQVASKIGAALRPGGCLVMAHANQLIDDPSAPGFDWGLAFGAKTIGDVFCAVQELILVKELQTPAYRIQLFQRERPMLPPWRHRPPQIQTIPQPTPLPAAVVHQFSWQGGHQHEWSSAPIHSAELPILMYHRVADTSPPALARYCVTPTEFAEQLRYLRDAGYRSVSLAQWQQASAMRRPLAGRPVLITFDDGYRDFATKAWPLLQTYGFGASVFLVAGQIGGTSSWDAAFGTPAPLMGWDDIRALHAEGVDFGAHTVSHAPLNALTAAEVVAEGARARAQLTRKLGRPIDAIAYPYGDTDPAVQHLIGACGYTYGLTVRQARCTFNSPLLGLPRIEVVGGAGLERFIANLA